MNYMATEISDKDEAPIFLKDGVDTTTLRTKIRDDYSEHCADATVAHC